ANLVGFCRNHHRLKDEPGWAHQLDDDGELTVTTPTQRSYSSLPETPPFSDRPANEAACLRRASVPIGGVVVSRRITNAPPSSALPITTLFPARRRRSSAGRSNAASSNAGSIIA